MTRFQEPMARRGVWAAIRAMSKNREVTTISPGTAQIMEHYLGQVQPEITKDLIGIGLPSFQPPISVVSSYEDLALKALARLDTAALQGPEGWLLGRGIAGQAADVLALHDPGAEGVPGSERILVNGPRFLSAAQHRAKAEALLYKSIAGQQAKATLLSEVPWLDPHIEQMGDLRAGEYIGRHRQLDPETSEITHRARGSVRHAARAYAAIRLQLEGTVAFAEHAALRGAAERGILDRAAVEEIIQEDLTCPTNSAYRTGLELMSHVAGQGVGTLLRSFHAPIEPEVVLDRGRWKEGIAKHLMFVKAPYRGKHRQGGWRHAAQSAPRPGAHRAGR